MDNGSQHTTLLKAFKQAEVLEVNPRNDILIVRATVSYIPIALFKDVFSYVLEIAGERPVSKIIFDKRQLSVFHPPSMEWYFVEWKEAMYGRGVKSHRKLLPADAAFREAVRIGREKLVEHYPDNVFNRLDIQYADTLPEAIER